jgi:hypothetical protein
MMAAFEAARQSLSAMVTDASATHMEAVIQQKQLWQGWRPLDFFSAQLDKAQVNCSAFDLELFAVMAVIKNFHYMLEGRSFIILKEQCHEIFHLGFFS